MADDKKPTITSKWEAVCDAGQDIELPLGGHINGFKGYHYDEMIKRLNSVDKGKIDSVGYLLRKLWKRHESGLVMHETNVYSSQHEQSQKANKDEFEKRYKKKEIGFRKDGSGVWGVYSDLLYDTYQKDWSKAYQLTFHYFFRNMDYLSNYMDNSKALETMKKYLRNSYEAFIDILQVMVLRLEDVAINNCKNERLSKYDPPLSKINPFTKKPILDQGFSEETEKEIEGSEEEKKEVTKIYNKLRPLIISMAQYHLYISIDTVTKSLKKRSECFELTYVFPHFCGKHDNTKEVYVGFYDYDENRMVPTMGHKFGDLLYRDKNKLKQVIHLHPVMKAIKGHGASTTMFSKNDHRIISSGNALWIGIEPFKGTDGHYYADTYISKKWKKIIGGDYQENIPAKHMERIEGLIPEYDNKLTIIKVDDSTVKCE